MNPFAWYRKHREKKKFRKLLHELRSRRHADDDILDDKTKTALDAVLAEPGPDVALRYHRILPSYKYRKIREFLDLLLVVGAVASGIRGMFFQPYRIPTGSMQPTLYGIHFMEGGEKRSNPLLGKLPDPINWMLFSARPARLEIQAPGELNLDSFRSVGNIFSDTTRFDIGPRSYTLPGDVRKVQEYSNLELNRPYRSLDLLCDGYLSLGDHLFVERFSLYLTPINRGDIMVFTTEGLTTEGRRLTDLSGFFYVKRLAGLPGDTLRIVNNVLQVKPRGAAEFKPIYELNPTFKKIYSGQGGYHGHLNHMGIHLAESGREYQVPDDAYFMLGDNSSFSLDSRFFGAVPRENLVGKAWVVFWPFTRRWGMADHAGPLPVPTGTPARGTFPSMYLQ